MIPKFSTFRIAVILALAEEYSAFLDRVRGSVIEKIHLDGVSVDVFLPDGVDEAIGLVCINKMGNVASGIAAARLLEAFDLDIIVNIGIAAGTRKDKQLLGDIVIADKIRYYEFGKRTRKTVELAPDYSDLRSRFLDKLIKSDYKNWELGRNVSGLPRNVHIGTIASGEKVISDRRFVGELVSQDRYTVGIEMESYGIASAVFGRAEKFLMIRGICDFADEEKDDSARKLAMDGATRLFSAALLHGVFSRRRIKEKSFSEHFSIYVKKLETVSGIQNTYLELERRNRINDFNYRKSIIQKMDQKLTSGTLRVFCVALRVDIDNLAGGTKIERIASLIEHCEKILGLSLEDIEQLLDS